MVAMPLSAMDYYNNNAAALYARYQALAPTQVHASWLSMLPANPGLACDIGAGSGRDACWLAAQGWDVVAVEPSPILRAMAQQANAAALATSGKITWLDDSLPELKKLQALDQRFNLILISAVWMHMPAAQHERAMRIVSELLSPGGLLVITLRNGPDDNSRFYPVSTEDVVALATKHALAKKHQSLSPDLERQGIEWDCLLFSNSEATA